MALALLSRVPNNESTETYGLEPVLSVHDAAAFLGVNPKTVYEAIDRGELPARRVGKRRLVILRHVLLGWLSSQERVSPPKGRR